MSRAPILIKDLVKGNQVWKMHIRVVDLWVVKEKNGQQHLELSQNSQVKENETYFLYNGEPLVNDGPFKMSFGVLQDVVKTQMGGGGKKSYVNITLRDFEGNVIEVVLWDDYDKKFINYNAPTKIIGPTIIILTHAWCKPNTGLPCLSNAWNGSQLYINLDHPQVNFSLAELLLFPGEAYTCFPNKMGSPPKTD
ncbi:uncharacterized protein LOC131624207 [Vicia villosa]|uniref:uncharacterized protein LOC131624207 n=1 Tax=Vicia villosa TaxID=3911 RepID=UPI00273AF7B8|nr:uncharacterized protein LOC131624207 [Vicia villosa]